MIKEEFLNESRIDPLVIQDVEASIFDIIIEFKKVFEKSDWKKNRKINMLIKQLLKLEAQLGDAVNDLS